MKINLSRPILKCLLRGMAFSALTNLAMPMAEAWAADEVQVLRKAPVNSGAGVVPFTTFQMEEQAVTQNLPCKWISKDGRVGPSYGGGRYDFLCKGGDFATISLYLDKADSAGNGVGKVRLLYRDWPVNANPNAGEAVIAQQYLQHVAGRFVPAAMAGEVMDAFWGTKSRKWSQNGLKIMFSVDKGEQFNIRRLEIEGTGTLAPQVVQMYPVVTPTDAGLTKVDNPVAPATKIFIYGKDAEKAVVPERVLPGVAITQGMPERVPTDAGLTKPMPIPVQTPTEIEVVAQPAVVLPIPGNVLPVPGVGAGKALNGMLAVPNNAPASAPKDGEAEVLQKATPAELNTAPAPESKMVQPAPPEPPAKLVPSTADLQMGSGRRAPSNFDAYNRAMELTKDVETRAQIARVEQAKVTASKPVSATVAVSGTTLVTPSTVVPAALKPLPEPGMETPEQVQAPAGEGLGTPAAQPKVEPQPAVEDLGQPLNYNGPRSSEPRPLPQLKFVPKAEPLRPANEVIQFEDEKSKL